MYQLIFQSEILFKSKVKLSFKPLILQRKSIDLGRKVCFLIIQSQAYIHNESMMESVMKSEEV